MPKWGYRGLRRMPARCCGEDLAPLGFSHSLATEQGINEISTLAVRRLPETDPLFCQFSTLSEAYVRSGNWRTVRKRQALGGWINALNDGRGKRAE